MSRTCLFAIIAVIVSLGATRSPSVQPAVQRIVMISIDGLSPSEYTDGAAASMPALRALAARGAWASGVRGVAPTVTYPAHTTLITGVLPAVHGVVDNHLFDPEGRSNAAWHWYAEAIRVPTLPGLMRASGGRAAAVSWPVTVGMELDYNVPEYWRSRHRENLLLLKALSHPRDIFRQVEAARGVPFSFPQTDRDRTDLAKHFIDRVERGIVLLHLFESDTAQHDFGPRSREAIETLERVDGYVAELMKTIQDQDAGAGTLIALVSDHGFRTYDKVLSPNALFTKEGLITTDRSGTITEWDAYGQSSGGSAYVYLKRPDDRELRERVRQLLERLRDDPQYGIERLWTRDDLDALGAHPDASFGIAMKNGFYTGQSTADLLRTIARTRGGHGYDPASRDMHASLILAGDGLPRRGDLGTIRMTQIAPTLARMVGVQLSPKADTPLW